MIPIEMLIFYSGNKSINLDKVNYIISVLKL